MALGLDFYQASRFASARGLTVHSSRAHIRAAPKRTPSAIFALSRRPAVGRLNSGVRPHERKSELCPKSAHIEGAHLSALREERDITNKKDVFGSFPIHQLPSLRKACFDNLARLFVVWLTNVARGFCRSLLFCLSMGCSGNSWGLCRYGSTANKSGAACAEVILSG